MIKNMLLLMLLAVSYGDYYLGDQWEDLQGDFTINENAKLVINISYSKLDFSSQESITDQIKDQVENKPEVNNQVETQLEEPHTVEYWQNRLQFKDPIMLQQNEQQDELEVNSDDLQVDEEIYADDGQTLIAIADDENQMQEEFYADQYQEDQLLQDDLDMEDMNQEDLYQEDQFYQEDQLQEDMYLEDQFQEDQYMEDQYMEDQYMEDQYLQEDQNLQEDQLQEDLYMEDQFVDELQQEDQFVDELQENQYVDEIQYEDMADDQQQEDQIDEQQANDDQTLEQEDQLDELQEDQIDEQQEQQNDGIAELDTPDEMAMEQKVEESINVGLDDQSDDTQENQYTEQTEDQSNDLPSEVQAGESKIDELLQSLFDEHKQELIQQDSSPHHSKTQYERKSTDIDQQSQVEQQNEDKLKIEDRLSTNEQVNQNLEVDIKVKPEKDSFWRKIINQDFSVQPKTDKNEDIIASIDDKLAKYKEVLKKDNPPVVKKEIPAQGQPVDSEKDNESREPKMTKQEILNLPDIPKEDITKYQQNKQKRIQEVQQEIKEQLKYRSITDIDKSKDNSEYNYEKAFYDWKRNTHQDISFMMQRQNLRHRR